MMRRSYPHTSDPAVLEAQRSAALARSVAAIALVCGTLAMLGLPVRDEQRLASQQAGISPVVTTAADAVRLETVGTSPYSADVSDDQTRVGSSEYSEYPSTF